MLLWGKAVIISEDFPEILDGFIRPEIRKGKSGIVVGCRAVRPERLQGAGKHDLHGITRYCHGLNGTKRYRIGLFIAHVMSCHGRGKQLGNPRRGCRSNTKCGNQVIHCKLFKAADEVVSSVLFEGSGSTEVVIDLRDRR